MRNIVVLLLLLPVAAPAQAEDLAEIEACIAASGEQAPSDCIGMFAMPCLDTPEGMSTHGSVACLDSETALWDDLLNRDYRKLMTELDDGQKEALRTAQRAWIALRDADCAFPHELIRGTLSQPWAASCRLDRTAERVLWLRGWHGVAAEFR